MARAKSLLAQMRATDAAYRQAKFVIVELAAALEELAPNHTALQSYRLFIQGAETPIDEKKESR